MVCNDVTISYNIFEQTATTGGNYTGAAISWSGSTSGTTYARIKILNNTIFNSTYIAKGAILNEITNITLTDTEIKNNIIVKSYTAIQFSGAKTVTGIDIMNNLLYTITNTNYEFTGATVTDDVYSDNILATDPLFLSTTDFHLQAGSPAINAGVYVNLTTDYDGQPVANPPEIGAFEYIT